MINVPIKKETVLYIIFGLATTAVNIISFQILYKYGLDYKIANLIALLLGKLFAYVTNKRFVFHSHCNSVKELCSEIIRFIFARGITGLIDYVGMIFAVELLHIPANIVKYILQVIIIILNYILSKKAVFKN